MEKKKIRFLTLVLLGAFLTGCGSGSRQEPTETTGEPVQEMEDLSLEDLKAMNGGDIQIVYSPETGLPKEIDGRFSSHPVFTAEDAVVALGSVRSLLQIGELSFRCAKTEEREDCQVFWLEQLYQGIVVQGGSFRVEAGKDGTARFLSGVYQQGISVDTEPGCTAEDCAKDLPVDDGEKIWSQELAVLPDENGGVLCWRFSVKSNDPIYDRLVLCDADTGTVIRTIPLAMG